MLLQVGPLQFDIAPLNAEKVAHDAKTDFAKKDVVGRRKIYEHVGEGDETLVIHGTLFPFKLGGLGALALAQALRVSAAPQYVVRGDGACLGWYVIVQILDTHDFLHSTGVGQKIEVAVHLERADSPGAVSSFTDLFGLAP